MTDRIPVWPDMQDGWALFLSMGTAWQYAGGGMSAAIPVGLRWEAMPAIAEAVAIKVTPDVFSDLRTLESEALKVWSARRG